MRAREIEKWLVKVLHDGATELADAEVARHVVRVFQLVEAMNQKLRPKDAREELTGYDDKTGEIHTSLTLLRARAEATEKARLARQAAITAKVLVASPSGAPAGASG